VLHALGARGDDVCMPPFLRWASARVPMREPTKIFAHSCQDENRNAVVAAHNLTEAPIKVVIKLWEKTFDHFIHLFDERPNEKIKNAGIGLELSGFGFSWLRLRQKKQIQEWVDTSHRRIIGKEAIVDILKPSAAASFSGVPFAASGLKEEAFQMPRAAMPRSAKFSGAAGSASKKAARWSE
jgi:hypothetical protein